MKLSSFLYKNMVKGLSQVLEKGSIPMPDKKEIIETDSAAKLNIIAWGDPQISLLSPLRSARVYAACQDVKNAVGNFDALVLLGDITEYGARCEYKMAAKLLNGISSKVEKVFAVSGNHDIRLRNYKKQLAVFNEFLSSVRGGVAGNNERYSFSYDFKGFRFIMLGADKTCFEASYISDNQLLWLEKQLASAPENKPVFVFNHQTLSRTNGLPMTWLGKGDWRGDVGKQSDALKVVLEKRANVIFVTGHLHYGISKYTFEDLGNIKAISAPTVGVLNHGLFDKMSQGLLIRVYENKIVCRARVFGEGRYVGKETENSEFVIEL